MRTAMLSSECVEILRYLISKIHRPELLQQLKDLEEDENIEIIDIKDIEVFDTSFSEWNSLLINEGYEPSCLQELLEIVSAQQLWKGEVDFQTICASSIISNETIPELIRRIQDADKSFLAKFTYLLSTEIAQQDNILEIAGGAGQSKTAKIIEGTVIPLIVIGLGATAAYMYRAKLKEYYQVSREKIGAYIDDLRTYFRGEVAQAERADVYQLGENAFKDQELKFEFPNIKPPNTLADQLKLATKAIDRIDQKNDIEQLMKCEFRLLDSNQKRVLEEYKANNPIIEIRMQARINRDNPAEFLEDFERDLRISDISPRSFIRSQIKIYDEALESAENAFLKELNDVAKNLAVAKIVQYNDGPRTVKRIEKSIEQEEIRAARNELVADIKKYTIDDYPDFKYASKIREYDVKIRMKLKKAEQLEAELSKKLTQKGDVDKLIESTNISLKDTKEGIVGLSKSITDADKQLADCKKIEKESGIDLKEQRKILEDTQNDYLKLMSLVESDKLKFNKLTENFGRLISEVSDLERTHREIIEIEGGNANPLQLKEIQRLIDNKLAESTKLQYEREEIRDEISLNKVKLEEAFDKAEKKVDHLMTLEDKVNSAKEALKSADEKHEKLTIDLKTYEKSKTDLSFVLSEAEADQTNISTELENIQTNLENERKYARELKEASDQLQKPLNWDQAGSNGDSALDYLNNLLKSTRLTYAAMIMEKMAALQKARNKAAVKLQNDLKNANQNAYHEWLTNKEGLIESRYGNQVGQLIRNKIGLSEAIQTEENNLATRFNEAETALLNKKIDKAFHLENGETLNSLINYEARTLFGEFRKEFIDSEEEVLDGIIDVVENYIIDA